MAWSSVAIKACVGAFPVALRDAYRCSLEEDGSPWSLLLSWMSTMATVLDMEYKLLTRSCDIPSSLAMIGTLASSLPNIVVKEEEEEEMEGRRAGTLCPVGNDCDTHKQRHRAIVSRHEL
jgi:hypothetical protein